MSVHLNTLFWLGDVMSQPKINQLLQLHHFKNQPRHAWSRCTHLTPQLHSSDELYPIAGSWGIGCWVGVGGMGGCRITRRSGTGIRGRLRNGRDVDGAGRTVVSAVLGKLSVRTPCDPAAPSLWLHTAEMHVCIPQKACAHMFRAELFRIGPNQK